MESQNRSIYVSALESRGGQVAAASTLFLLAVLPYLNTLHNEFVYDDLTQILINPYVRNFHHLRDIFMTSVWSYRGGAAGITNYFRPLMLLLYLLCYQLFGPHAAAFHAVNILLNAGVVIVLWKTSERMFNNRTLAFITAAMFALHPIHTEPVAWIGAVVDLQLSCFYLLTFWIFLGLSRPNRRSGVLAHVGMSATFALALLSKEPAITLPLLATIYEHFYRDDRAQTHWLQKVSRYAPFWALDLVYAFFRTRALGAFVVGGPSRYVNNVELVLSAVALIGQYLLKFLLPVRLSAYYIFPEGLRALLPSIVVGVVGILILAWVFIVLWRRDRTASFGLIWFFVTLAPALSVRWMPSPNVLAERYLYLPSVGLCWVIAWGLVRWSAAPGRHRAAWRRRGLATALAALGVLCAARIVVRNRDWHDNITFYTRTLEQAPTAFEMLNNLGAVYYNNGDKKAAEKEWLVAYRVAPTKTILLDNISLIYTDEGRYDEAVATLLKSIRAAPNDAEAHINLGMTFAKMHMLLSAEGEFRDAVKLSPLNARGLDQLAKLYIGEARYPEAVEMAGQSVQSVPSTEAYLDQAFAYWYQGQTAPAESTFKKAEALNPYDSRPHFDLAFLYADTRRTSEAIQEYEEGFKTDPKNPVARAAFQKLKGQNSEAKPR